MKLGINLEFGQHEDLSFEKSLEVAAAIGYRQVEPMVHTGRQLLSEGARSFAYLSRLIDV